MKIRVELTGPFEQENGDLLAENEIILQNGVFPIIKMILRGLLENYKKF